MKIVCLLRMEWYRWTRRSLSWHCKLLCNFIYNYYYENEKENNNTTYHVAGRWFSFRHKNWKKWRWKLLPNMIWYYLTDLHFSFFYYSYSFIPIYIVPIFVSKVCLKSRLFMHKTCCIFTKRYKYNLICISV